MPTPQSWLLEGQRILIKERSRKVGDLLKATPTDHQQQPSTAAGRLLLAWLRTDSEVTNQRSLDDIRAIEAEARANETPR